MNVGRIGKLNQKRMPVIFSVAIGYIVLFIIFSILTKNFLTVKNIMNIGQYASIMGIVSIGMTFAIISGGLDLSVGSVMGMTGMVIATVMSITGNPILGIIVGVGLGALCGVINGILIAYIKVLPLIATLATMSIFRGAAYLTTDGQSMVILDKSFGVLGREYVGVVPICFIVMLVMFFLFAFISRKTIFGREVYSIGSNSQASHLAGINVKATRFKVYIITGLLAGLSGTVMASMLGAGVPYGGESYEMDAIAAVVLGGTSIAGGKGSIWGTLLGVFLLVTLSNGMNLLSVQSFWQMVVKGIVLLLAVIIDAIRGNSQD